MINSIKNKNKSDATQSISLNGIAVTDKKTISNAFNQFFVTGPIKKDEVCLSMLLLKSLFAGGRPFLRFEAMLTKN